MIIAGAGGHAREIIDILETLGFNGKLVLFDNTTQLTSLVFDKYPVIHSIEEASKDLEVDTRFVLGLGGPHNRLKMFNLFTSMGGKAVTVISKQAFVSTNNTHIEEGGNIMFGSFISNQVTIGKGTLVNAGSLIHHNVTIGSFSEIAPGCILAGAVEIGHCSFIGAGTKILPKVIVGNNVTVGAGSVVNRDLPDNVTAIGVPAKIK